MGLFRKFFGFLGLSKDDDNHDHDSNDNNSDDRHAAAGGAGGGQHRPTNFRVKETGQPRRGFSVKAQVVNDRPQQQLGPVLAPSTSSDGGVQVGPFFFIFNLRLFRCRSNYLHLQSMI